MKRLFSRICGAALAAALVLSALPAVPARAAGIQVTLNDQPLSFSEYSTIVGTNVCINSFPELFIFPYIISNSKRKSRNFSITTISRMILNRFLRFLNGRRS